MVTMSGRMPLCSNPNHRPVRPNPVCTSSRISNASRSSHNLTHGPHVFRRGRVHATFALYRLEHHRRDALVEGAAERVDVVEEHLAETFRQRLEGLLFLRLAGGRQRGERAPVERSVRGEHVETVTPTVRLAVAPRELDRALVGLGT